MKRLSAIVPLLIFSVVSITFAQTPDFPRPTKEHKWLKQFDGQWQTHAKMNAHGEMPAMECDSTMKSRMLGDFWVLLETTGEMEGVPVHSIQTVGYDPKKKKYIGTWVDSMTHTMYHYEGTVDEAGKKLTLEAEGPDYFDPSKTAKYRDSYEFKSVDHIVSKSEVLGEDGKWFTFATGDSRRKKSTKQSE